MNKKNIELRGNVLWTGKPRKRTANFGNNEIRYRLNLMTKVGVVNCWINIKDKPDYYRLKVGKGDVIEIETKQITENDDGDLWCYVTLSRKFDIITDHGYTSKLIEQEYSGKRDKLDRDDFFILTKNKINKEYWEKVGNKLSIWFMKNYGKFFKLKTLEILLSFLEDLSLHSGMKLGLRARKLKYLETPDGLEIIESRPASGLYSSAFYGVPETHVKSVLSIARENDFNIETENFLFISEIGETFIDLYKHVMRPAYCEEYRLEKEEKLKQLEETKNMIEEMRKEESCTDREERFHSLNSKCIQLGEVFDRFTDEIYFISSFEQFTNRIEQYWHNLLGIHQSKSDDENFKQIKLHVSLLQDIEFESFNDSIRKHIIDAVISIFQTKIREIETFYHFFLIS